MSQAPTPYIAGMIAMVALAFVSVSWGYARQIEALKAKIDSLSGNEDQNYRENPIHQNGVLIGRVINPHVDEARSTIYFAKLLAWQSFEYQLDFRYREYSLHYLDADKIELGHETKDCWIQLSGATFKITDRR